jgi:pyruvate dehydrogenase E2 component (dihydrolipoamide acetyltransferase)
VNVETGAEVVVDIRMPKLSDSMEEATVLAWLKQPGETIRRGDPLVEVETDKADVVYEAEAAGVLEEIVVGKGETAELGQVIARLRTTQTGDTRARPAAEPGAATEPPPTLERGAVARAADALPTSAPTGDRARATPSARRLAEELGVSLDGVSGSGPGGRIVGADVRALAGSAVASPPEPSAPAGGRGTATELPLTATQKTIARRMAESRAQIPDFTLQVEIAMHEAARLRQDLRAAGTDPLPSHNDLVVRAAALALRDFPALNASYAEEGKAVRHGRINVGIAVATDDALLVPTIHDADRKSVGEIAAESRRLAERARDRSLTPDDLADGTFTVSNLGMFGIRRFNAVINPPQVAILAVGEVAERPVVVGGVVVARRTMEVSLSCDHRVVYGAEGARFLTRLRDLLEHPTQLVEEVS